MQQFVAVARVPTLRVPCPPDCLPMPSRSPLLLSDLPPLQGLRAMVPSIRSYHSSLSYSFGHLLRTLLLQALGILDLAPALPFSTDLFTFVFEVLICRSCAPFSHTPCTCQPKDGAPHSLS